MKTKRTITVRHANGFIPVEIDALDLCDLMATADLCRDPAANFRAAYLAGKIADDRAKWVSSAVYVITSEGLPVCKIGHAASPNKRLLEVQVGNWNPLSIAALLWTENAAYPIEQLALKAAKEMGIYIRGEWIAATPDEATELVLKAARHLDKPVCDSATWLDNWSLRLHAHAEATGRADAIGKLKPRSKNSPLDFRPPSET